jgi:hypothetical protein
MDRGERLQGLSDRVSSGFVLGVGAPSVLEDAGEGRAGGPTGCVHSLLVELDAGSGRDRSDPSRALIVLLVTTGPVALVTDEVAGNPIGRVDEIPIQNTSRRPRLFVSP